MKAKEKRHKETGINSAPTVFTSQISFGPVTCMKLSTSTMGQTAVTNIYTD
jgi:hypothetical protein